MKYKEIQNKVDSELYKAKKELFCNKFEDCAQTKHLEQRWDYINHLLGKHQIKQHSPGNSMIAETFNDFFVSIWPKLSAEIDYNVPI